MNKTIIGIIVAAALMLLLCVFLLNRGHRELVDARRDAEGARLALQHQTVELAETKAQLRSTEADLIAKNPVLGSAVAEAKTAAPGAQTVSASVLKTSPEKVKIVTVTNNMQAAVPPAPVQDSASGQQPTPAACALSNGESAWFKVDLIELQTKEQNTLVTGTAELWAQGSDLTDRRVLGPSRFQSQASQSAALAPPVAPRWGAEALGLCRAAGCGLGAGVLFPPLAVLGAKLEARAGALLGPEPAVMAGVGLRF